MFGKQCNDIWNYKHDRQYTMKKVLRKWYKYNIEEKQFIVGCNNYIFLFFILLFYIKLILNWVWCFDYFIRDFS